MPPAGWRRPVGQLGPLRPDVADAEPDVARHLALDGEAVLLRVAVAQVGAMPPSARVPGEPGIANGFASVNCGWPFVKLLVLTVVTENGRPTW